MKKYDVYNKQYFLLFSVILVFLPGCGNTSYNNQEVSKDSMQAVEQEPLTGEVLVSMDGTPLITTDSLQNEKDKLLKSNPQLKAMMAFMDAKQFDRNLCEGLSNQAIVDKYIITNNVREQADYKVELQEGYKAVERMINTKYFSQSYSVVISDSDVRDFYEKNKTVMPNLLVSRGGVQAMGIKFDMQQAAQDFINQVKENKKDLDQVAKDAGLELKDFKLVNDQSIGIDTVLRDKIIAIKIVPSLELINVNNKDFWVISVSKKEEAIYRSFEQVKVDIRQFLEKEKRSEQFEKEIDRLKAEYKVILNEEYFKEEEVAKDDQEQKAAVVSRKKPASTKTVKINTSKPVATKAV